MFEECATGARCALTLSVGLDSLYALCSFWKCASFFAVGLDSHLHSVWHSAARFSLFRGVRFPVCSV